MTVMWQRHALLSWMRSMMRCRCSSYLYMRAERTSDTSYQLNQRAMIVEMLGKIGLANADSVHSPISSVKTVAATDCALPAQAGGDLPSIREFQSLVGSLLWIARCTRRKISIAVHRATRRTHAPALHDWALAKRIARLLSGTRELKLKLSYETNLECLCPSAATRTQTLLAIAKIATLGMQSSCARTASFSSEDAKKPSSVATSTAEAEFVADTVSGQAERRVYGLLHEMGLIVETAFVLYMDNQAAILQINNKASSASAKQVDIKLKFLREYANKEEFFAPHVGWWRCWLISWPRSSR